jgi:DNA-binding response OmpR family regulator
MLGRMLALEGHTTLLAADGNEAIAQLAEHEVDLMLLDLIMPNSHGYGVLDALRDDASAPPVIVLSAVTDVSARVDALNLGAIDFVGKPFHPAELVARVRRHLSSPTPRPTAPRFLEAGGIQLDLDRRRARSRDGSLATLTELETSLLAYLMRRCGQVCRRDELLRDVWGLDFDPGSNVIEVCVRRLRVKLSEPPIETVRAVGYVFDAE